MKINVDKEKEPALHVLTRQVQILAELNETDLDAEQIRKNAETILRLLYAPIREGVHLMVEDEIKKPPPSDYR